MTNGIKIVSSIYELNYVEQRNYERYKNYPLLVATIKNLIFPEFKYVIYTDKNSYEKFNLQQD